MTDKLFDDFFKQKLDQHDSGSPMHVWEKVRRELHEDDDDKVVVWWRNPLWLLALLLFIGTSVSIAVIGSNNHWFGKPTVNEVASNSANNNDSKQKDVADKQYDVTSSPAAGDNEMIKEDKTISSIDNINDLKTTVTTVDNDPINANKNISNNGDNSSLVAGVKNIKPISGKSIRRLRQSIADPVMNLPVKDMAVANLDNDSKPAVDNINDKEVNLSIAEGFNKTSLESLLASQQLKTAIPFDPQRFTGCPTIGPPKRNDLYLEIYGSADNVSRSLTGTVNAPLNYIDKRKDAEKSQVGFSAGVRIAKNIGERLVLKTGFNYSQINEHLKFINEKDVRTVTVITTRTVTSGGQTITISDTTTVTQVGTSYNNYYNRYRTVDVPLIFSYELGNSRNLKVGINAGAIINLTSWYRGKILDTSLSLVNINTSNTLGVNAWKKNIGLGLYGSLSIYKRLNDKMQLFFEPYIRYNLKPVNVSETVVKQKYITTGLQVGIRYNLFHKRQRYIE